ncbi:putative uncharacterized protein DDB_G0282133 [Zeugodacus cucurbitae]|uniref:putative uncharacterized protein DDB_G0282133 n=1 Tax=Zeugodacus cucurbitae TaxID=28588 RepID=UPI0023D8EC32|nr:putative uncharacterized protein DDB_G0282133 [Zeugodacus cucurbitae]
MEWSTKQSRLQYHLYLYREELQRRRRREGVLRAAKTAITNHLVMNNSEEFYQLKKEEAAQITEVDIELDDSKAPDCTLTEKEHCEYSYTYAAECCNDTTTNWDFSDMMKFDNTTSYDNCNLTKNNEYTITNLSDNPDNANMNADDGITNYTNINWSLDDFWKEIEIEEMKAANNLSNTRNDNECKDLDYIDELCNDFNIVLDDVFRNDSEFEANTNTTNYIELDDSKAPDCTLTEKEHCEYSYTYAAECCNDTTTNWDFSDMMKFDNTTSYDRCNLTKNNECTITNLSDNPDNANMNADDGITNYTNINWSLEDFWKEIEIEEMKAANNLSNTRNDNECKDLDYIDELCNEFNIVLDDVFRNDSEFEANTNTTNCDELQRRRRREGVLRAAKTAITNHLVMNNSEEFYQLKKEEAAQITEVDIELDDSKAPDCTLTEKEHCEYSYTYAAECCNDTTTNWDFSDMMKFDNTTSYDNCNLTKNNEYTITNLSDNPDNANMNADDGITNYTNINWSLDDFWKEIEIEEMKAANNLSNTRNDNECKDLDYIDELCNDFNIVLDDVFRNDSEFEANTNTTNYIELDDSKAPDCTLTEKEHCEYSYTYAAECCNDTTTNWDFSDMMKYDNKITSYNNCNLTNTNWDFSDMMKFDNTTSYDRCNLTKNNECTITNLSDNPDNANMNADDGITNYTNINWSLEDFWKEIEIEEMKAANNLSNTRNDNECKDLDYIDELCNEFNIVLDDVFRNDSEFEANTNTTNCDELQRRRRREGVLRATKTAITNHIVMNNSEVFYQLKKEEAAQITEVDIELDDSTVPDYTFPEKEHCEYTYVAECCSNDTNTNWDFSDMMKYDNTTSYDNCNLTKNNECTITNLSDNPDNAKMNADDGITNYTNINWSLEDFWKEIEIEEMKAANNLSNTRNDNECKDLDYIDELCNEFNIVLDDVFRNDSEFEANTNTTNCDHKKSPVAPGSKNANEIQKYEVLRLMGYIVNSKIF